MSTLDDKIRSAFGEFAVDKGLIRRMGVSGDDRHVPSYRDIKPQNILRCDDAWKIADFGISKLMNNPVTGYTFQGAFTAPRDAPEQITEAPAHPSADVYAWARVVGYMLTGKTSVEKTLAVEPAWREILGPCVDFHPENRQAIAKLLDELGDSEGRSYCLSSSSLCGRSARVSRPKSCKKRSVVKYWAVRRLPGARSIRSRPRCTSCESTGPLGRPRTPLI